MPDIEFQLNGNPVVARSGESLLDICKRLDIKVPQLCYHPDQRADGNCRACMVEIQGERALAPSCRRQPTQGMVVDTRSERAKRAQKGILALLESTLSGEVYSREDQLRQWQTATGTDDLPEFRQANEHSDSSHPAIDFRADACILCTRCVRACREVQVNNIIGMSHRGSAASIVFDLNDPLGDSRCVGCGECVQACPTGALSNKNGIDLVEADRLVDSVCPYCGVGCKLELQVNPFTNKIVKIEGVEDSITNKGMLCVKGRFAHDFVSSDKRLTTPLIKENGKFREASWEEATSLVASKFLEIKEKYGSEAITGLASAKCTNEENYAFQKFMRKEVGTNSVDHCARLCHSSTVAGLAASLGSGAMTNDIPGIRKADVIMIIGSDTSEAHPVLANRIKKAARDGKTKLIVIDPKKIRMADYADIYAAQKPGSDVALINAFMREIILNNWYDKEYVANRCENFEDLKAEVLKDKYSPENAERISGVKAETIKEIAKMFGTSKIGAVYYAMGITQHTTGTDNVWNLANLQMLCGNLGVKGFAFKR